MDSAATERQRWNESMVAAKLTDRFPPNEYALLRQVRNGTGFQERTRTADAVAMSLWPSRGMHIHGIEIKVSRSDWLHELKKPEKAEEIARFCNFWWLAVPDTAIVQPGELPEAWGLIDVGSQVKAKVVKAAKHQESEPPTITFVASLLRAACSMEEVSAEDLRKIMDTELRREYEKGVQAGIAREKSDSERVREQLKTLQANLSQFEGDSGIRIDRYSQTFNGEIGKAVAVLRGGCLDKWPIDNVKRILQSTLEGIDQLETAVLSLKISED